MQSQYLGILHGYITRVKLNMQNQTTWKIHSEKFIVKTCIVQRSLILMVNLQSARVSQICIWHAGPLQLSSAGSAEM